MAEMTRDEAYEEALRRIGKAGGPWIDLSHLPIDDLNPLIGALKRVEDLWALDLIGTHVTDLSPLTELPKLLELALWRTPMQDLSSVAGLMNLRNLEIDNTKVSDLSPLKYLSELQSLTAILTNVSSIDALQSCKKIEYLALSGSNVSNLSPIKGLENLGHLAVTGTQVADLRPVLSLPRDRMSSLYRLDFDDTPATENDPTLAELAKIENDIERTEKTLAYLRTLPPWPEPLPWQDPKPSARGTTAAPLQAAETSGQQSTALRPKSAAVRELMQNDPSAFADHVMTTVEQLQSDLANQKRYIPNDPDALQDWEHLTGSLQAAITALSALQPTIPTTQAAEPTEEDVNLLIKAFENAIETLRAGCAYADKATDPANHGHHSAQFHKIGICVALGGVLAIPAAITAPMAIPAVASILYGKDFAKTVIQTFKPGSTADD